MKAKDGAYKLDERNHVEKPLLDQLSGLGWEIIEPNFAAKSGRLCPEITDFV